MEFAMTKMSTKGQIVIPKKLRKDFKPGEEFIVIKDGDSLVLERASSLEMTAKERLEQHKRIEKAYRDFEAGKGITMDFDDFMEEIKKW